MGADYSRSIVTDFTSPLFTLLCGYFWGARNTRLEWAGIVLGLIGIAMLNVGSNLQSSPLGAGRSGLSQMRQPELNLALANV